MAEPPIQEYLNESGYVTKEQRMLGVICYAPFGFAAPYFMGKSKSCFVEFHTKQGAIIFAPVIVLMVLTSFFYWGIAFLFYLTCAIMFGLKAYEGEMYTFTIMEPLFMDVRKRYEEECKQKEGYVETEESDEK